MNLFLAATAVSGNALVSTLVWVIVVGLIFWLALWLIGYCGVPEPFNKVLKVILAVCAFLFLVNILLGLAGHPLVSWR